MSPKVIHKEILWDRKEKTSYVVTHEHYKVEVKIPELVKAVKIFKEDNRKLFEVLSSEIKSSIANTFNQLLQAEMDLFLGQADQSTNKRNGFYEREFAIKGIGLEYPVHLFQKMNSWILA